MSTAPPSTPAPSVPPGSKGSRPAKATVDPKAGKAALDAALDWTKVSTGVATGALVFGVGLLNGAATYENAIRIDLMWAWVSLGVAILSGIVAQSAIPPMIADKNYDLEFAPYTWPARIHQVAWLAGIVALALALRHILFGSPALDTFKISNAQQAVTASLGSVPAGRHLQKTAVIELIKGADPSDPSLTRWHIQFLLTSIKRGAGKESEGFLDVLVDPTSGRATTIGR